MKIKASEVMRRDVRKVIFTFLDILECFLRDNNGFEGSNLEILYVGSDEVMKGDFGLYRVMFSVHNEKNGVTLSVTHNSPVKDAPPFFTLGDESEEIFPYDICTMLLE